MPNMNPPKHEADILVETVVRGQSIKMPRTFYRLLHYLSYSTNDLEVLAWHFERSPKTVYRWTRTLTGRYKMSIEKGWYTKATTNRDAYYIRDWGDLTPFRHLIVARGAAYNCEHTVARQ